MQTVASKPDRQIGLAFLLFTVFFLVAMFLPRVVTQGMFGDELLYAAMARNLAEGRGSYWAPFFSNGYWIENLPPTYFENLPLTLWLQSGFFRLLGDHWWVEKVYSGVLMLLSCVLLARLWEIPLRGADYQKNYVWLPLFLFYLIPVVIWGLPNNLMEGTMLVFSLAALYSVVRAVFVRERAYLWITIGGVFVFAGVLAKGPVALYPLAAPFLFALVFSPRRPLTGLGRSFLMGGVVVALFAALLLFVPASQAYFQCYWEQRLSVALAGGREDGVHTGLGRLHVFVILLRELLPILLLSLLVWVLARKKMPDQTSRTIVWQTALFFTLTGFAATLPLLASTRQAAMYLIPGLPMFALAAGYFLLPLIRRLFYTSASENSVWPGRLRQISLAALVVALVYSGVLAGRPGREHALLRDLEVLKPIVPKGSTVGACDAVANNFVVHTYWQRFHQIEISRDVSSHRFFATDAACDSLLTDMLTRNGYTKTVFNGETLIVREKTEEKK